MITPVEREIITKIKATRFFEDVFIKPLFSRKEMKSKERECHDEMFPFPLPSPPGEKGGEEAKNLLDGIFGRGYEV